MEKQPETEEQTFDKAIQEVFGERILFHEKLYEVAKVYRIKRSKIEAQQVAGMSLDSILDKEAQRYPKNANANCENFKKFEGTYHAMPDAVHKFWRECAEVYASACVAEKEKELVNLREQYNHMARLLEAANNRVKDFATAMIDDDNRPLLKRIEELESSQAVVTDEEIETTSFNLTFIDDLTRASFQEGAKWMRSKLSSPLPDKK